MRQILSEKQMDALLSLYSERDFPKKTRQAVRLRIVHGYTYELAEFETGVSRRNIYRGIQKLENAHRTMMRVYGGAHG
ncbi:hypothetical protein [Vibrio mediterranei]|jgi:hypothetical protein|uniref:Uncharacterized protein n=1 Tax=Vibrio mediterranei TaxID=689 RepID=A0ABX5D7A0_9VIBR|nr:hypothetical protein [Vibrio mediterranei]PCD85327.1 hypothetical protein COR52_27255 [Vibrio mediterranei]PRQ64526.1 hypothetical protein COR51_27105 [Vibrio mediterranei]